MTLGNKLKTLRGNKTIKAVADALDITEASLKSYEADEREPRDSVKIALANYYGITLTELLTA